MDAAGRGVHSPLGDAAPTLVYAGRDFRRWAPAPRGPTLRGDERRASEAAPGRARAGPGPRPQAALHARLDRGRLLLRDRGGRGLPPLRRGRGPDERRPAVLRPRGRRDRVSGALVAAALAGRRGAVRDRAHRVLGVVRGRRCDRGVHGRRAPPCGGGARDRRPRAVRSRRSTWPSTPRRSPVRRQPRDRAVRRSAGSSRAGCSCAPGASSCSRCANAPSARRPSSSCGSSRPGSAERARIAREMHDVLAHRISLLSLHAGALEFRPDAPAGRGRARGRRHPRRAPTRRSRTCGP